MGTAFKDRWEENYEEIKTKKTEEKARGENKKSIHTKKKNARL